jgi:hypothetical protein
MTEQNDNDQDDIGDDDNETAVATAPAVTPDKIRTTQVRNRQIPDPILEPSAKELANKRQANIEASEVDDLPQDFAAALALSNAVTKLPPSKQKDARLKRIARHLADLQRGVPAPTVGFRDLHSQFYGRPPTADEVAAARKSLLKK